MNNQEQLLENKYDKDYKTIKNFLNSINDSIRSFGDNGYDTKDIYVLYDMLRYEVLSDDNIKRLSKMGLTDDVITELNTFNGLISDLNKEYIQSKESLDKTNKRIEELGEDKPIPDYDKDTIKPSRVLSRALASIIMISPYAIGGTLEAGNIYIHMRSPKVTEYTIDSTGKQSEKNRYDWESSNTITIEEYSEKNDSGFRLKRDYVIDNGIALNKDILNELDLTLLEPQSASLISESELVDAPDGSFRVGHFEVQNKDEMGKTTDFLLVSFINWTLIITSLNLMYGVSMYYRLGGLSSASFLISDTYQNLINLAKYKIAMKKYLKELKVNEKEKVELEKLVNTLSNRTDKTIVKFTEALANIEYEKQLGLEKNKNNKFKSLKEDDETKQKEIFDKIREASNKENELINNLQESDCDEMYHSINITESLLFEKDGDHYKIASAYLPNLRFLNLLVIDFTNVDIRYVDFRGTNAIIDPQKIYNKDASYAKFDEYNLRAFANYKGVNLTGSELDIIPETMVSKDEAIISEDTVIKHR